MEDPATSLPSSLWASLNSWFTSTVFFVLLNLMIATIVFTSNLTSTNNHQQKQDNQPEEDKEHKLIARSPSILHRLKSLNFYPQKFQESSQETEYHQHPLEAAATQYVFNQPLEYQHFDFDSTNSDQIQPPETDSCAGHVTESFDFDQFRQETGTDSAFDFDPTRQETWENTRFDFDPTRQEIGRENGYDFDPVRQDTRTETELGFVTAEEERADEFESLDEVYSRLKGGGHDRTKSDGSIGPKPPAKMKKSASLKLGSSPEEEIVEARRPATVKGKTPAVREEDDVEVDSRADDFINKFKNDLKLQRIESIMRKGVKVMNRGGGK